MTGSTAFVDWRYVIECWPDKKTIAFAREALRCGLHRGIAVPDEYRGHRILTLAFHRGFVIGFHDPSMLRPRWYTGEEMRRAYRRGWNVAKALRRRTEELETVGAVARYDGSTHA